MPKKVYKTTALFDKNALLKAVEKAIENGDVVRFERVPPPRTGNQNRYYRALINILSDYTGYSHDETHVICKRHAKLFYKKEKNIFLTSTVSLDTKQMSEYTQKVIEFGAEIDCYLPTPEEWHKSWEDIESTY